MKVIKKFQLSAISKACIVVLGITSTPLLAAEDITKVSAVEVTEKANAAKKANAADTSVDETEVIEVLGVRGSIRQSINDKRFANEIMDSLSAEDIGQMPDENIAESLSRITGVLITRNDEGEGTGLSIRGSFDNNIEVNGSTLAGATEKGGSIGGSSGLDSGRSVNLQDIPAELFSSIDVYKTAQADLTEGSLGGSVNLKTKKPLQREKENLAIINTKLKYSDIGEEVDPEFNLYLGKNFLNTKWGDFGGLLTLTQKDVRANTEAFGAGIGSDGASRWVRQSGFNGAASGPNGKDLDDDYLKIDVNGDGVSDVNDVYYAPSSYTLSSNERLSDRKSFNSTLQWQPNDKLSITLDATYTKYDDIYQASKLDLSANKNRAFALASDDHVLTQLGDVPGGTHWKDNDAKNTSAVPAGPVAYVSNGLLGGGLVKMGCNPCQGVSDRESKQANLAVDYQINDDVLFEFKASTSDAESERFHGAMSISQELGGNWKEHAAQDGLNVYGFNETGVDVADVTIFDNVDTMNPVSLDHTNLSDNWRLSTLQRQASLVQQDSDTVKFDFTHDIEDSFITEVKYGGRWAERSFTQQVYYNQNKNSDDQTWDGIPQTNVQDIFLNKDMNGDPENNDASDYMTSCMTSATSQVSAELSGNLPGTYTSFDCDMNDMAVQLGLPDIYALTELGDPVFDKAYENTSVTETTTAAYLKLSFEGEVKGKRLWGNVGNRWVKTEVAGTGIYFKQLEDPNYEDVPGESPYGYSDTGGQYFDHLPSLNVNLAIANDKILRVGWGKTLGRRGLKEIAPRMEIWSAPDTPDEYTASGKSGNINLPPRRAENVDVSFEWYFADAGMLSVAYYYREIANSGLILDPDSAYDLELGDNTYYIQQNKVVGHARRKGYEINYQQSFEMLPGLLKHTGFGLNYTKPLGGTTFVDQEGDTHDNPGVAKHNGNAFVYYDDNKFSVRAAYNYRSEHVVQRNRLLGYNQWNEFLPSYKSAYGQLDVNATYKLNKNLKINFAVRNLTDEHQETYAKYKEMTDRISYLGRKYTLGVTYKF
ncbi:MAG: iron complex outermembrane receptor protein [Colwellia sp.]|jgi:iron complex outermembrane receptor protein